jgi:Xaa-Pro aminopeptidase
MLPVLYADYLRSENVSLQIDPQLYRDERRQKTAAEVEGIEEAQRATERAVRHAIELLSQSDERDGVLHFAGIPLTSERLRAEIEVALTRDGMDSAASPIVAGGPGAADPHWLGSGPLRAGEAIVLDVFPRSKRTRYFADMTRTVVKGNPREELKAMYQAVLRAQEAAFGEIRAGANGRDVHAAVEAVFEEEGFSADDGPRYIHGTGHGIGLEIHEAPVLGAVDLELKEGDVVTVEPGLYDPKLGAVRIEDLVVVTRDGYRNLTEFPKQFEL